jgi:hypothetical protein
MRVQTISVRPSVQQDLGNEELLTLFLRGLGNSVAGTTHERFENQVREAVRYFTRPDGREIPVREWTKEEFWGYVHYAESSYCANFV